MGQEQQKPTNEVLQWKFLPAMMMTMKLATVTMAGQEDGEGKRGQEGNGAA
jgi:hypothetical protein